AQKSKNYTARSPQPNGRGHMPIVDPLSDFRRSAEPLLGAKIAFQMSVQNYNPWKGNDLRRCAQIAPRPKVHHHWAPFPAVRHRTMRVSAVATFAPQNLAPPESNSKPAPKIAGPLS